MATFLLEISTPSKPFFLGKATSVIVRTENGEETFMAGHIPACKLLSTGELRLRGEDNGVYKTAAISGGYIEVFPDEVTIFTNEAFWAEDIDLNECRTSREAAEKVIAKYRGKSETENDGDIFEAKLQIARAINKEKVAKKYHSA
ncbi:MAG: ATP synthase F1 subunit epsilon [Clostridiales Family XIII bacterium]|jgi:F-type H+-transporting ATPase subunit epsilon|nr:ATP synthase F1 subunit epsilon [Clostridiales Family XIII bacterium]